MVDTVPADSTSEEAIVGFNEEVRKTARRLRALEGGISLTSGVTGTLPVSRGGTGVNWSTVPQGEIPYFSATGVMNTLDVGTSGYFLKTQGAGADPVWAVANEAYAAGTVLLQSADTSRAVTALSYTKAKEIIVARHGTLTIKFSMTDNAADGIAIIGRIYRNGSAVGTERTLDAATTTEYSEDISGWVNGDYCQVYLKRDAGLAGASVSNFRIYATKPTTELVTTDTAI